jgi:hypothetical protein
MMGAGAMCLLSHGGQFFKFFYALYVAAVDGVVVFFALCGGVESVCGVVAAFFDEAEFFQIGDALGDVGALSA